MLTAILPAGAETPTTRGIDRVCPAPDGESGDDSTLPFPDMGSTHAPAIACAFDYEIVSGFTDGNFRPSLAVTRGQMASFVAAWLRAATGISLADPVEPPFSDIEDDIHGTAIARLAAAGVINGYEDGTYRSEVALTRGQFTRAVTNAISYADVFAVDGPLPPDDDSIEFTDVEGTTHADSILALAGAGIALGKADGSFQPEADVTRGQLTTFLMRAADYLDRHQRWRPTARARTVLVTELRIQGGAADGSASVATATFTINAFNGTLAYSLDVSEVQGTFRSPGASLHVVDPLSDESVEVALADRVTLRDAAGGVVTGVILESDSPVRFADLIHDPGAAEVRIATSEGTLTGQLRGLGD